MRAIAPITTIIIQRERQSVNGGRESKESKVAPSPLRERAGVRVKRCRSREAYLRRPVSNPITFRTPTPTPARSSTSRV